MKDILSASNGLKLALGRYYLFDSGRMIKFADSESSFDDANFIIYGYPFDGTACFRKGTALAPDKVREESYNFETYLLELMR